MKKNLVGYTSDGASVMTGHKNGLIAHMRDVGEHPLFAMHCMAHKLNLVIVKGFGTNKYFEKFEHVINKVFQIYAFLGQFY